MLWAHKISVVNQIRSQRRYMAVMEELCITYDVWHPLLYETARAGEAMCEQLLSCIEEE